MDEETVEAVPSADNGNVPVDAPSEQPTQETPASVETVQPTEPELFELPDGRKVDAAALYKEHTENLLPEFTRRSQELAELKKGTLPNNEPAKNPYADPNYVPQSYEEILKVAEERALQRIDAREQKKTEHQQAIETEVATQLDTLKKADANLNENALFFHANKYGFRDLPTAYQNMKDMSELAKKVQQTTATNIAKRNDPVSATTGNSGGGTRSDPSQFSTARDYLRSLK